MGRRPRLPIPREKGTATQKGTRTAGIVISKSLARRKKATPQAQAQAKTHENRAHAREIETRAGEREREVREMATTIRAKENKPKGVRVRRRQGPPDRSSLSELRDSASSRATYSDGGSPVPRPNPSLSPWTTTSLSFPSFRLSSATPRSPSPGARPLACLSLASTPTRLSLFLSLSLQTHSSRLAQNPYEERACLNRVFPRGPSDPSHLSPFSFWGHDDRNSGREFELRGGGSDSLNSRTERPSGPPPPTAITFPFLGPLPSFPTRLLLD